MKRQIMSNDYVIICIVCSKKNRVFKKSRKKKNDENEDDNLMDEAMADPLNPNAQLDVERDPITGEPIDNIFGNKDDDEEKSDKDNEEDRGGYALIKIPWSFTVNYSFGFVEKMPRLERAD